jgi:CDP-diacylglycerol--glycerol-3-phosphate 3-phosphatidyltransferase
MLANPPSVDSAETVALRRLRGTVFRGFSPARLVYAGLVRLGRLLGALGVSANALTGASLLLAVPGAAAVALGGFWWAIALFLASGALDALDGAVARATHTESRFGALLDSTSDRASDALPLMGATVFLSLGGHGAWVLAPLGALVTSFAISYVRARAEGLGFELPTLFMRRAERLLLTLLVFVVAALASSSEQAFRVLGVGLAVLGVLQAVGAIAALRAAHRYEVSSARGR